MTAIAPALVMVSPDDHHSLTVALCPHDDCTNSVSSVVHSHLVAPDGGVLVGVVRSACGDNHPKYDLQPACEADSARIIAAVHELGGGWTDWRAAP